MEKNQLIYLTKQIHFFSILSVFLSALSGLGMVFAIPCFTYAYHIKKNYITYNEEIIIKSMFYCAVSIIMSMISLFIFLRYIIN